ncbi:hypothetical protein HPP92_022552 [Vanilla planifolia]|uniref:Maternal effect embryo arrest 22 n=1 Tax=Vanilla planifolia TaxID=51239 RepID=A0A835PRQ6_VANPL|nr:hypothetical protein HPP92_022552 [Vanilla planifolia]
MAADWMKRCEKLEKSRDALRQGVKILEGQIKRQSVQIASLKNEVEQQQIQAKHHKDEWMKEVNIRKEHEEEIQRLKFEQSSIQKTVNEKSLDLNDSVSLKARISEGEVEINRLRLLFEKEKLKIDSEKKKAVSEKKKASEVLKQLQEEKKRVEEQRGLLESERKKSEEFRLCLEKLKIEANGVREKLNAETSKVHDAKKQIEVEKLKADKEKKRADLEKKKVEEQKKLIEEERKSVIDVKLNADILSQKLEEERRKRQEVQKKMEEISVSKECRTSFSEGREQKASKILKVAELKLLKEQLKLERKRVKHAERVAKQEKSEKKFVMQEVRLLKQNLVQILCQLNMLDGFVSHRLGSADAKLKTLSSSDWSDLKLNSILLSKNDDFSSETEFGPSQIPLTYADPEGACIGLPVPKRCCNRTKTGIVSELGSPVGGFLRNKSQSSAVCSTSMHFTDRKLMGSQGRDSHFEVSADKLAEQTNLNFGVPEYPGETAHVGRHKSCHFNSMYYNGSSKPIDKTKPWSDLSPIEDIDIINGHNPKKRKIQSVTKLDILHSKEHNKLSALNHEVSCADHSASINCSHCYSGFGNIYDGKLCQKDVQSNPCKHNHDCIMIESSSDCQTGKMFVKHDNKSAIVGCVKKSRIGSCCIEGDEPDSYHFQDVETALLGNEKANLADFEGIINEGCLKLLELDSDVEEEKYRKAVEMPLSPTLPEIQIPAFQIDGDDSLNALEKNDVSVSHCFFDVMHVEISSNNSKLKIPVTSDLSGSRIAPQVNLQDIAPLDILHSTTNDNCQLCEGGFLVGESSHPCRKLNKEPERVPLLMEKGSDQLSVAHFPSEPTKAELPPISKGCNNDTNSLRCETAESSFNLACGVTRCSSSQIFHEDCHALDVLSLSGNLSSDMNFMTEILGDCQPINSVFCESQIKVSAVHDPFVAQNSNQILAPEAQRLIKDLPPISSKETMEHNFQQSLEPVSNLVIPVRTSCPNERMKSLSKDNHASDSERNLCLFSSLLSLREKKNIPRILHALSIVTPQNFMVSKIDLLLVEVLNGLELEQGLPSEDKVAIIYSILLGNLSARLSDHCKHIVYENSFHLLDSFTVEIVRGISALMTKCGLDQMFKLDDLLCLMESFLIDREVLVIGDVEHHPSSVPTSPKKFHIDVGNKCLLSNDVTICQFVAGCMILASICVAADDFGFILVLSYKILRTDRDGFSWVLLALHVFASICGKKMFNQDSYCFLLITIKSVVSFLEREFKVSSASLLCCLESTSKMAMGFPTCKHCPFATGSMGMDELSGFLLEVLHGYSLLWE